MTGAGRKIGLAVALAMLVFSAYIYVRTGDWVALVFIVGSLAYAAFFFSGMGDRDG
jgi:hypothetical protein